MPTSLDNLALNGSTMVSAGSGSNAAVNPVVVIQNQLPQNPSCLPCNEDLCSIAPTTSTNFDLGKVQNGNLSTIRLRTINGSDVDSHMTLNLGLTKSSFAAVDNPVLDAVVTPNAFSQAAFTVNGFANAGIVSGLNTIALGYSLCNITIQGLSTNAANVEFFNSGFNLIHQSVRDGSGDSIEIFSEYTPFCQACFNNNNGDMSTFSYTGPFKVGSYDSIDFFVPAGANLVIQLGFSTLGIGNTSQNMIGSSNDI